MTFHESDLENNRKGKGGQEKKEMDNFQIIIKEYKISPLFCYYNLYESMLVQ